MYRSRGSSCSPQSELAATQVRAPQDNAASHPRMRGILTALMQTTSFVRVAAHLQMPALNPIQVRDSYAHRGQKQMCLSVSLWRKKGGMKTGAATAGGLDGVVKWTVPYNTVKSF